VRRTGLLAVVLLGLVPSAASAKSCPPQKSLGLQYVTSYNRVTSESLLCAYALMSADSMIRQGVQYKGASFRMQTNGARWVVRWSCTRRWTTVAGRGRVALVACRARSGELEPGAGRVSTRSRLTFRVDP
jgi:hypothetical protein